MINGSNLTGGDCVWDKYPVVTGPVSGQHYLFVTNAEVDRLIAAGCGRFRLLFSWECLQPKPWATPASLTGNYLAYWQRYKALVDYITSKGCVCVIDIHGGRDSTFGAYRDVKVGQKLPSGEAVTDMFENLYWNLGQVFRDNPLVEWGLTNEPVGMTAAVWFAAAQKAINSLRNVGAKQTVWAPGIAFTGAGTWVSSGNAAAWNLTDPASNLGVQVHMYLDANAGGGATDIVNDTIGITRLSAALTWARSKGLKVLLGEVGISAANPIASATWTHLAVYMQANADVLAGWCWWATGPLAWWGGYQFNLCDTAMGRANLQLIATSLKPFPAVDVEALQARIFELVADNAALGNLVDDLRGELSVAQADLERSREDAQAYKDRIDSYLTALTTIRDEAQGVL